MRWLWPAQIGASLRSDRGTDRTLAGLHRRRCRPRHPWSV